MDQIQYGLEKANLELLGFRAEAMAFQKHIYEGDAAVRNCARCKAHGLRAEIWTKDWVTVVYAICPACGYVQEI